MRHANVLCPLYWLILWNDNYLKFRASPLLRLRKYGMCPTFWGFWCSGKLSKSLGYITVPELWKVGRFKRWRKMEQIPPKTGKFTGLARFCICKFLCYKGNEVCCLYCMLLRLLILRITPLWKMQHLNSHLTLTSDCQLTVPLIFQRLFPFLCVSCTLWPSYPCRFNHVGNIKIRNDNSRSFRRPLPLVSISLLNSSHVSPNIPLRPLAVRTAVYSLYIP